MEETTTYPIRVYRFEKNGYGPYQYLFSHPEELVRKLLVYSDHRPPPPWDDGIPDHMKGRGIYGCSSIEELIYWFDDCVELLFKNGYHIAIYETTSYWLGGVQVVFFDKRKMNSILSMEELIKLMGE